MNEFTVIFLIFLALGVVLQIWLALRHQTYVRSHQDVVPSAFAEKISLQEHQKAATYTLTKVSFGQKMLIVEILLLLLWTLGGGLDILDRALRTLQWTELWTGVAVILSFGLLSSLIDLPANIYSTFRIEARFGFNRITPRLFIIDLFKEMILGLVIGIPFLALVLWLMAYAGELWWLYVWLVWMGFSLIMMWLFPTVIAPLFNKFQPIEDQELKERIEGLLQRNGFASKGIFVMDGSKRSSHGNAYFTGFGSNKRIVFFDTLLKGLNVDEIEAVLAHEVGHFKNKHIQKRILSISILSLASLALLGWLMQQNWFFHGLGISTPSTYMALLLFSLALPIFTFFFSPIMAWFSRRHEFEADDFAAKQANPLMLIQALVKLYKDNASTLTPDPLYSAFYDSHPPAPVRIAHLSSKL
ncbi:M48 family metallopeptidase [Candidatus Parabeggiatoa sp. HSG14]|uniref:M48 family metallopeptidase n=1 Tax=Candidatus Parabeggiatoa sp. HSG14 TaxID=3055593 RepID=UPI0025A6CCF3|nr:M48 family metallopeptidase [Thiotrichales bacterium HSG14]